MASVRRYSMSLERRMSSSSEASQPLIRRWLCFAVIVALAGTVVTNFYPQFIQQHIHSNGEIVAKRDEKIITLPLHPRAERLYGSNHYFLFPNYVAGRKSSTNATALSNTNSVNGVLIYLHACQQSGLDAFHLPESRIVLYDALQNGLAVLAPTSSHRESGCFTFQDLDKLPNIVNDWAKNHNLEDLPRVGMGDSSGASFLFFVFKELGLKSMAVYNTPQAFLEDEWPLAIPTIFLTMPPDKPVATLMTRHCERLQHLNISTQVYKATARPFTGSLCAAKLPEIPGQFCQQIFESTLETAFSSLLNAHGFVQGSSHSEHWIRFFEKIEADFKSYQQQQHKVSRLSTSAMYDTPKAQNGHSWVWAVLEQEVRTCQCYHAMTADFHEEIIQFLQSTAGILLETV